MPGSAGPVSERLSQPGASSHLHSQSRYLIACLEIGQQVVTAVPEAACANRYVIINMPSFKLNRGLQTRMFLFILSFMHSSPPPHLPRAPWQMSVLVAPLSMNFGLEHSSCLQHQTMTRTRSYHFTNIKLK